MKNAHETTRAWSFDLNTEAAAERLRTERLAYRAAKRAFDITLSIFVLAAFSWLFLVIAIAIKLDDPEGPVFFTQERVGRGGTSFRMYKFRSMYTNAESMLPELKRINEKSGPAFKLRNDPRITRVGHALRKMSLDELPQFVNVLRGDLSVVGPRPALPCEVASYTPYQRQRLLVNQGLTCYWQTCQNRDAVPFDQWIELDLLYIRTCSMRVDLKLIIQTVGCMLTAQGE